MKIFLGIHFLFGYIIKTLDRKRQNQYEFVIVPPLFSPITNIIRFTAQNVLNGMFRISSAIFPLSVDISILGLPHLFLYISTSKDRDPHICLYCSIAVKIEVKKESFDRKIHRGCRILSSFVHTPPPPRPMPVPQGCYARPLAPPQRRAWKRQRGRE